MPTAPNNSFDREHWQNMLERIALALGKDGDPVELCLIGSASCILGGMAGRTSLDLDVGRLRVTRPPFENIVASKLVRSSVKDIQDMQFIMQNFRPNRLPELMKCLSAALLTSVALICFTVSCYSTGDGVLVSALVSAIVMIFSAAAWWAATKHE